MLYAVYGTLVCARVCTLFRLKKKKRKSIVRLFIHPQEAFYPGRGSSGSQDALDLRLDWDVQSAQGTIRRHTHSFIPRGN